MNYFGNILLVLCLAALVVAGNGGDCLGDTGVKIAHPNTTKNSQIKLCEVFIYGDNDRKLAFVKSVLWARNQELEFNISPKIIDGGIPPSQCDATSASDNEPFWIGYSFQTSAIRKILIIDTADGADKMEGAYVEINGVVVATDLVFGEDNTAEVIVDPSLFIPIAQASTCVDSYEYPEAPVVTNLPVQIYCPADFTIEATLVDHTCVISDPTQFVTASGTGGEIINDQIVVDSVSPNINLPITGPGTFQFFVSVSYSGQSDSCSFTVQVVDSSGPRITGCKQQGSPPHKVEIGQGCSTTVDPNQLAVDLGLVVEDACSLTVGPWQFESTEPITIDNKETKTITLVSRDASGNPSTCDVTIIGQARCACQCRHLNNVAAL